MRIIYKKNTLGLKELNDKMTSYPLHFTVQLWALVVGLSVSVLLCSKGFLADKSSFLPIIVPYVKVDSNVKDLLCYGICFCAFLCTLLRNKGIYTTRKTDFMGVFFLLRLVSAIYQIAIITFVGEAEPKYGNYLLSFAECLLYFTFSNANVKEIQSSVVYIPRVLKVFSICVSIEVIMQSVVGVLPTVPYLNLWYKGNINIPIGNSNTLAAIILPVVGMSLVELLENRKRLVSQIQSCQSIYSNKKLNLVCVFLGISAVLLTKSRGAIVVALLAFAFYESKKLKTGKIPIKHAVLILSILIAIAIIVVTSADSLAVFFSGYSSVADGSVLNKLTSGRLSSWTWYFDKILYHPILGNGPNYLDSRAHMIVIDVLYSNGLLGLSVLGYAFWKTIRKAKLLEQEALLMFLSVTILFSFTEISFFSDWTIDLCFIPVVAVINRAYDLKWRINER